MPSMPGLFLSTPIFVEQNGLTFSTATPVFFEDIASFCELIFLPHELDWHALIPV
jgi:hypothetical protein